MSTLIQGRKILKSISEEYLLRKGTRRKSHDQTRSTRRHPHDIP